jgi:hypothetical protein
MLSFLLTSILVSNGNPVLNNAILVITRTRRLREESDAMKMWNAPPLPLCDPVKTNHSQTF